MEPGTSGRSRARLGIRSGISFNKAQSELSSIKTHCFLSIQKDMHIRIISSLGLSTMIIRMDIAFAEKINSFGERSQSLGEKFYVYICASSEKSLRRRYLEISPAKPRINTGGHIGPPLRLKTLSWVTEFPRHGVPSSVIPSAARNPPVRFSHQNDYWLDAFSQSR
jgi:hypothetical protein